MGAVFVKDLVPLLEPGRYADVTPEKYMRSVLYVPEGMTCSNLLHAFQKARVHLAIVVDEYGGTEGMVTMEDLLEELVGDIWDEDEEIIRDFVRIDSQHFLISGDLTIRELFDHLDLPFSNLESNHTSCGGWALEALGHIPQAGEAFQFKNMTLTIQEMDDQRVKKLSVYLAPQPEEEEKSRQESNQQE